MQTSNINTNILPRPICTMRILVLTLISFAYLTSAAARVYTGFNYGAFWSYDTNVKKYADFHNGFSHAKNLTNVPVPFDSARLFTCITAGTKDDPTEAFQAAIDTGTNLLLGMWVSPGVKGQSNDIQVANELAALGKAFQQHGPKLADLVIGLSVGNEDIYRSTSDKEVGIGMDDTVSTIQSVRENIAESEFAKYMEGKPIGHTDTSPYAVVKGSDFAGMNAYPYWSNTSIADASRSFMGSLEDTQRRAGDMPVWITEMGWPIKGAGNTNDTLASTDNYQKYWTEVGCQVFGKYNTFWFELLQDSQPEQPDWGLLNTKTFQPRIPGLGCGGNIVNSVSAKGSDVLTAMVSPSDPPLANNPAVPTDSSDTALYTAMVLPSNPSPATLSTVPTPASDESASEYEAPTDSPAYLATGASAPLSSQLQTTQVVTTRTSTTRVTRTTTITAHHSISLAPNGAAVHPPPAPLKTTQPALTTLETTQPAPHTVHVTHTSTVTVPASPPITTGLEDELTSLSAAMNTTQPAIPHTIHVTHTSIVTVPPSPPVATSEEVVLTPPASLTPPPMLTSPAAVAPPSSPVVPPSAVAPPSSPPQYPSPPPSPIPTTLPYAPSALQNSPPIITGTPTCTANPVDTVCIVMMDLLGDSVFIPVATHASDVAACKPPPRFSGTPLRLVVEVGGDEVGEGSSSTTKEGSSSTLPEGGSESACEAISSVYN